MTEIIDYFEGNGSISLMKDLDDNTYTIYFNTRASYYYCINDCGGGRCHCKDKDWSQGTWNGKLFSYCDDEKLSKNIFNYLKDNFDRINNLNRSDLRVWFHSNGTLFINKYYYEEFYIIKLYVKYLFHIDIFNIYFFQKLKNIYFEKYKEILEIKINNLDDTVNDTVNDNFNEVLFKNDTSILVKNENYYFNNNSRIETLQQKSLTEIKNQQYFYEHVLIYQKFTTENTDINIETINISKLDSYISKFRSYNLFPDFSNQFENLKNNFLVETFFKKNNIDDKYKMFFNEDLLDNIYDKINKFEEIYGLWLYMTDSQAFSF
jgi:hypothetical protein